MVDNTTAVSCIMNMGTSHSKPLIPCNHITFEIWEWCIYHSVWLSIAHIPGVANVLADKASRLNTYHTEWMLSRKIFAKSIAKLGVTPQIDLFASRLTYQLEPYISYQPDPGPLAVNAFHSDWSEFTFYAFPPFSIIQHTLSKIREDQATGRLIVPKWPTQTWYPQLLKMLLQHPIMLPRGKTMLTLPSQPAAVPPTVPNTETDDLSLVRTAIIDHGISQESCELIMSSWKTGTKRQYGPYIRNWERFCYQRGIDPISPSIADGLQFLTNLFHHGLGYSAIDINLKSCSHKVVMLLALLTGQRCQTLHAIIYT